MNVKAKYLLLESETNTEHEHKIAKVWRGREMQEDGFLGLGGHSAYQEANLWSSWWPCSPSLLQVGIYKTFGCSIILEERRY